MPEGALNAPSPKKKEGPVRLAILGQAHWSRHLARLLQRHAPDLVDVEALPGSAAAVLLWRREPAPRLLLRVGYRPGAPTARGIAFDLLWAQLRSAFPQATGVYYWLGTDLMRATQDASRGRLRGAFQGSFRDRHLAVAPWHLQELEAIGVEAAYFPLPYALPTQPASPMPSRFAVLSYLPAGGFGNYGGREVFALAREFPAVPFRILGADHPREDTPPNVDYPGRLPSTDDIFKASSVLIRLTHHDGVGGTVLEALAHGRHVIYTFPLPYTNLVKARDVDAAAGILARLLDEHRRGVLGCNDDGRRYVLATFDETRLSRALAEKLVAFAAPVRPAA